MFFRSDAETALIQTLDNRCLGIHLFKIGHGMPATMSSIYTQVPDFRGPVLISQILK